LTENEYINKAEEDEMIDLGNIDHHSSIVEYEETGEIPENCLGGLLGLVSFFLFDSDQSLII